LPAPQARVCEASPSHSLPANTQACGAGNVKTSRGTIDRSVHRDALSEAAWSFEAAPPPLQDLRSPAELPLCAALMVGGSISRLPPPTGSCGQGTSDCGLTGGFEPPRSPFDGRLCHEVCAIFATDQGQRVFKPYEIRPCQNCLGSYKGTASAVLLKGIQHLGFSPEKAKQRSPEEQPAMALVDFQASSRELRFARTHCGAPPSGSSCERFA
jgi:hypothetical protein